MVIINPLLKEKLEKELLKSDQDDILLPGKLQYKKEMADMFDDMTNPLKIEERKLKKRRSEFKKKNMAKVGL